MEALSRDSLVNIFRKLPIKEKLKLLPLSRDCQEAIEAALRDQKVLGNDDTLSTPCPKVGHRVSKNDLVPHPFNNRIESRDKLVDYTSNLFKMCPNVTVVKLFVHHRPLNFSYKKMFDTINEVYSDKLRCLALSTMPRTYARMPLNDDFSRMLGEYELLISRLPRLKHLSVPLLSDIALDAFLTENQELEILEIWRLHGSGECFKKLPPSMKVFIMKSPTPNVLKSLIQAPAMETLELLEIRSNKVSFNVDEKINFKNLKHLNLCGRGTGFTAKHFKGFANSKNLEVMNIQNFSSTRNFESDDFKEVFAKCKNLREVKLNNDTVNDQFFLHVSKCHNLQHLELCTFQIMVEIQLTDQALIHLKELTKLQTLVLEYYGGVMHITENGLLELLNSCEHLEKLIVKRSSLQMITSRTRAKLIELVNQRELEGKEYAFELEHSRDNHSTKFIMTSK
ncbi:hypothetical protein HDE_07487 [Halotydeus destructor]|nr:hypothetical protein HDE_07487 [Halotydeus destructor]